jgi:shikimate dehydrogenase
MNPSEWKDSRYLSDPGKRLAVLGDPIHHSLSPAMHNAALRELGEAHPQLRDWHYHAIRVASSELKSALEKLHADGVVGINLTLPHKVDALDLIEAVEPTAASMGAVNTLIRTNSGYRGTNTDGYGIARAIEESFGSSFRGKDVWIFGAGGAARGISVEAIMSGCERLTIVNRTASRLESLKQSLKELATGYNIGCRFQLLSEYSNDLEKSALVINATSLGLHGEDPCPIPRESLRSGLEIYDTTYGTQNALKAAALEYGCCYADGLSMLVWQGARSLEIWTGASVPVETMRQAALQGLMERI